MGDDHISRLVNHGAKVRIRSRASAFHEVISPRLRPATGRLRGRSAALIGAGRALLPLIGAGARVKTVAPDAVNDLLHYGVTQGAPCGLSYDVAECFSERVLS